jgi:FMN phosphatase YigB (HAD superfamily)
MTKPRHILTDADGVLLVWNEAFDVFMKRKGLPRITGTENSYNLTDRYGITYQESVDFVKDFNEGEYMRDLLPLSDSVEYVQKLVALDFRFTVITSISDNPISKIYRTENLINLFGDIFDDVICLETGASKTAALAKFGGTGLFWIEDHFKNAEAGYEVGLKSILIEHPYNKHYSTDLFPRVSKTTPWKEIYEIVTKEYGLNQ